MAQISKGDTFTDGQQVTGARLNQLVDSATLLAGVITEQGALTAATVASDDLVLISDTSASALRKATVNDILGSSLPVVASSVTATSVVTSVVNAVANSDILITPNDGANVTSKTFSSVDGITSTVASTAHGLVTGQNVTITASNASYSGTYKITVTTVDAFTYVVSPATTAASGTCSYVREGSVRINGELNVSAGLNVAGATTVSGATTLTGATTASGAFTSSGTANFTGVLQVNGAVGYVLTDIVEETLSSWTAASAGVQSAVVTTASFTKPSDEIWVFEIEGTWTMVRGYGSSYAFRYSTETFRTGAYLKTDMDYSSGVTHLVSRSIQHSWVVPLGTALTARTVAIDVNAGSGSQLNMFGNTALYTDIITTGTLPASKFRIYKYKTA
jgi:hypothetical protein